MGPKKRKLTKAEKLALQQAEEERKRHEEELARLQAEEEECLRLEQERLLQEELERIRLEEAEIRDKQQSNLLSVFISLDEKYREKKIEQWNNLQWYEYVHVWRTISPLSLPMVNAFLSEWEDDESGSMKDFFVKCHKCLEIKEAVEVALMNCPELSTSIESAWEEILANVKTVIAKKTDLVTYLLLQNSADNLSPDSYNMEYGITNLNFEKHSGDDDVQPIIILCLWANLVKNLRYKGMYLPNIGVRFELPSPLVIESCAVRLLYTSFDAVTSESFDSDFIPSLSAENVKLEKCDSPDKISEVLSGEVEQFVEPLQSHNDNISTKTLDIPVNSIVESSSFVDSSSTDILPQSESSTTVGNYSSSAFSSSSATDIPSKIELIKKECIAFSAPDEPEVKYINRNEYFVVGGIFHFDLLKLPKQPVEAGSWILNFCEDEIPEKIFYKTIITPIRQPPPNMSPAIAAEFSDSEIKRFDQEMTTAVALSFRLPKGVLFLEQPQPAFWVEDKQSFTTSGFFDVHLTDDGMLSVKVNQFGKIVLLERMYANYPLKSWELISEKEQDSVLLVVTGAIVILKIRIDNRGCYIQEINPQTEEALSDLYELCLSPDELLRKLLAIGVNLQFHENGSKYVEIPPKVPDIEDWTNLCISLLCLTFTFSWSKWNRPLPSEKIVLQCCEIRENSPKEDKSLVLITPERATFLKCSESDKMFEEEPLADQKFFSDLYYLLMQEYSGADLPKITEGHTNLVMNLYSLLQACKLFSCS